MTKETFPGVRALHRRYQNMPTNNTAQDLAAHVTTLLTALDSQQLEIARLKEQLKTVRNGRVQHRMITVRSRGMHIAACSCGDYMSRPYLTSSEAMERGTDEHFAAVLPTVAEAS